MLPAVIARIVSMQPRFTVGENKIAKYIIDNFDSVIYSTTSKIATETKTSAASVNRFCKKLGYKGLQGFKLALAQESFYNKMKEQRFSEDNDGLIASVARDYSYMLQNTSALLEEETIDEMVECIKSRDQIYIFALSNNFLVAQEMEFKLNDIDIASKAYTDNVRMRIASSNIDEDDLAILIAPTIMMRDIYNTANICKERGAKIATLTSYDAPKLNELSDYKLITSDKIIAQNSVSISDNLMFLYVIDVIYSALLRSDKALYKKKLNSDAILNNSQMAENYTFEY